MGSIPTSKTEEDIDILFVIKMDEDMENFKRSLVLLRQLEQEKEGAQSWQQLQHINESIHSVLLGAYELLAKIQSKMETENQNTE